MICRHSNGSFFVVCFTQLHCISQKSEGVESSQNSQIWKAFVQECKANTAQNDISVPMYILAIASFVWLMKSKNETTILTIG